MSIHRAISFLQQRFSDRLKTTDAIRYEHASSEAYFPKYLPDAVVFVENTVEVAEVLRICHAEHCPVIPWGTGTSLEGHALAVRGGITINMMSMNRVLAVYPDDMDAVLQPGVTRIQLNEELRATGLFFSVDPGADASIGGMASTRASGTTALRYGTMRENIRALEVVLADGRIIRTGSRTKKSSAGYDLTSLLMGAEGTLGIITELTVRLHGVPESVSAATCAFPTIAQAVQTVVVTMQHGIPMARMEVVDSTNIRAINRYSKLSLPEEPHLFLEFHGSQSAVAEQAETVAEIAADCGGKAFDWQTEAAAREKLWKARHAAYPAMVAAYPEHSSVLTDICVPISRLTEMIEAARADIEASPIEGAIIGHVGDGNFHTQLMVHQDREDEERAIAKELAERMAMRAIAADGTISGEHGIGIGKMGLMSAQHGEAWPLMGELKRQFDPHGILNPGKMVPDNI